jgi:hypothetical protein
MAKHIMHRAALGSCLTTAADATCTAILTEDLPDGTVMAGVRIVNPFGIGTLSPRQRSY